MARDNTKFSAIFGGGCFWCIEAVFQHLTGVEAVVSGYAGGCIKNPTYKQVCTGNTGHAEVVKITYDPSKITFEVLLEVFFQTHDPTTYNRQGNDIGTQYRSVIFYQNAEQQILAEKYIDALNHSESYGTKVVTEVAAYTNFYIAEQTHQDYYNDHSAQPYCLFVIKPKVEKVRKLFRKKAREDAM